MSKTKAPPTKKSPSTRPAGPAVDPIWAAIEKHRAERAAYSRDVQASSNAAIRRRIALIAAERKLDPSETMAMMKGRWITMFHLCRFAKKHSLSLDWLMFGDLKGLRETVRGCPSRPRALSSGRI